MAGTNAIVIAALTTKDAIVIGILAAVVFWLAGTIAVASYAERNRQPFWPFFFLSLFAGWIIGLIVVLLAPQRPERHPRRPRY